MIINNRKLRRRLWLKLMSLIGAVAFIVLYIMMPPISTPIMIFEILRADSLVSPSLSPAAISLSMAVALLLPAGFLLIGGLYVLVIKDVLLPWILREKSWKDKT